MSYNKVEKEKLPEICQKCHHEHFNYGICQRCNYNNHYKLNPILMQCATKKQDSCAPGNRIPIGHNRAQYWLCEKHHEQWYVKNFPDSIRAEIIQKFGFQCDKINYDSQPERSTNTLSDEF